MVARAWPVSVEVIQDGCLLPRVKRAHPHVSMTLLSEISLWSLSMEVYGTCLLRCSKWLLGAWLDSFTMILRCWLVIWVKWARPLVSKTLWSRVMFNWKAVSSQWGQPLGRSCPPGCKFYPIVWYVLTEPVSLFKCGKFHISTKSTLWAMSLWILVAKVVDNGC